MLEVTETDTITFKNCFSIYISDANFNFNTVILEIFEVFLGNFCEQPCALYGNPSVVAI